MTDKEIKIGTIIISRGASFTTKHLEEISRQFKRLEAENVRLREKFNNLISTPIYENCNLLLEQKRRLEKCLQEIKAIAKNEVEELTDSAINGGRYLEILDLITKAEEK